MFRRKPIPATGPVNDLELALFPDVHGDLSIEILANKQRYDEPTLIQHAERLKMLIAQFAADPALLCGDVDIMLPVSMRSWRSSTPLRLRFQKPRLARWWQNKRQNTGCSGAGRCALPVQLSGNARAGGGAGESAA